MTDTTQVLVKERVVDQDCVFVLKRLLKGKTLSKSDIESLKVLSKLSADEIEEACWNKRRTIVKDGHEVGKKIAGCIYCDFVINEHYKEETRKKKILQLITTVAIQVS